MIPHPESSHPSPSLHSKRITIWATAISSAVPQHAARTNSMSNVRPRLTTALACLTFVSFLAHADDPDPTELVQFQNPTGPVTLVQALGFSLRQNPSLKAFTWEIRAAE